VVLLTVTQAHRSGVGTPHSHASPRSRAHSPRCCFVVLPFVGFWLGVGCGTGQPVANEKVVAYEECQVIGGVINNSTNDCWVDGKVVATGGSLPNVTGDKQAEERHEYCTSFNTGGRAGRCAEDAPDYCSVVYYSPSCPTCQDGVGCGYVAVVEDDSFSRQQGISFPKQLEKGARLSICDELRYPELVDHCYMQYAQRREDSSLCAHVQDEDMRVQCY